MTLEITLRRPLLPPLFIQTGNEKPRKAHWLGDKEPARAPQKPEQGGRSGGPSREREARGYRDLASITLGEVRNVYKFFEKQLTPGPHQAWVGTNHFCMFTLSQNDKEHPPAIFGRVSACHPSDGYVQNIQEMELSFPQKDAPPATILLRAKDILLPPQGNMQGYCIRVKFLASREDIADFAGYENLFLDKGFIPDFSTGYIDLLELRETEKDDYPWLYVVGSRWFASIPESVQPEIREKLAKLIQWNKLIFDYHPERLAGEIRTLNRELGYKAGFTDLFLIEPENPEQTLRIVSSTFEKIFQQPMK